MTVAANSGEIWVPADTMTEDTQIKVENAAEVQQHPILRHLLPLRHPKLKKLKLKKQ